MPGRGYSLHATYTVWPRAGNHAPVIIDRDMQVLTDLDPITETLFGQVGELLHALRDLLHGFASFRDFCRIFIDDLPQTASIRTHEAACGEFRRLQEPFQFTLLW